MSEQMVEKRIGSGAQWEDIVGYSRAVRKGNMIWVSGCAPALVDGQVEGGDDPYAQAMSCLGILKTAIEQLGGQLEDVVRTRIYVTDIAQWEEIGKAHGAYFAKIKPAATMVEVKGLIVPEMLVEIEADACLG
ncbi:MAG: RidA family protein [Bacteroidota bacterium]